MTLWESHFLGKKHSFLNVSITIIHYYQTKKENVEIQIYKILF